MSLGSGAVTLSTTPTITVNSNTLTLGGAISGSGLGLTKAGDGTLVLGGSSTYSGATTVSAGTLEVTGNIESSNVGINFGATMSGIGNAGGTVTLNSGGILSPGLGGTGTLKVNALIWNGAASATPTMDFTLSNSNNSSTLANVTNTFVKGSGVDYLFNFEDKGFFSGTSPTTYTLIDFGHDSGFSVGNFTYEISGAPSRATSCSTRTTCNFWLRYPSRPRGPSPRALPPSASPFSAANYAARKRPRVEPA